MARAELLYVVDRVGGDWTVRCETELYGPYRTVQDAVRRAVQEAEAAGRVGFDSRVLVRDEPQIYALRCIHGAARSLPSEAERQMAPERTSA